MRVVTGIILKQGKLLLGLRRMSEKFGGGFWEFPGGKVKEGESDEEALRREIDEEIGARILSVQFFKALTWEYPNRSVNLNFFKISIEPAEISQLKKNVHDELRWFSIEEALASKILPANVPVLQLLTNTPSSVHS